MYYRLTMLHHEEIITVIDSINLQFNTCKLTNSQMHIFITKNNFVTVFTNVYCKLIVVCFNMSLDGPLLQ